MDELNQSQNVHLLKMIPYEKCTALNIMYAQLPYNILVTKTKIQIPLNNDQVHGLYNTKLLNISLKHIGFYLRDKGNNLHQKKFAQFETTKQKVT